MIITNNPIIAMIMIMIMMIPMIVIIVLAIINDNALIIY